MLPFLRWDVGERRQTHFWDEPWLLKTPLSNFASFQHIKPLFYNRWGELVSNYWLWQEENGIISK